MIDKPTLYAYMDSDTGCIEISALSVEDPLREFSVIELYKHEGSVVNTHRSVLNILYNVLCQAGVTLIIEE